MPIIGRFGSLAGLGSLILPGGAMESIATVTVGSGGASSITFSDIPGGFQHLQVRLIARTNYASTDDLIKIKVNTDTGANYAYHALSGNGATASANAFTSDTTAYAQRATGANATSSVFGSTIIDLLDYASTTKNKTMRGLGAWDNNGSGTIYIYSNLWMNSSTAITALTLTSYSASNFAQHTTAALYGIKAP